MADLYHHCLAAQMPFDHLLRWTEGPISRITASLPLPIPVWAPAGFPLEHVSVTRPCTQVSQRNVLLVARVRRIYGDCSEHRRVLSLGDVPPLNVGRRQGPDVGRGNQKEAALEIQLVLDFQGCEGSRGSRQSAVERDRQSASFSAADGDPARQFLRIRTSNRTTPYGSGSLHSCTEPTRRPWC